MATDRVYKKIQEICLSFPGTKETPTWGKPHFRVGEKIFCGYGQEGVIGFKLDMTHAKKKVKDDPRFAVAPYVGNKGWVTMDVSGIKDWDEVRVLVQESYTLIAPKKLVNQIGLVSATKKVVPKAGEKPSAKAEAKKSAAKEAAAKKPAVKKPAVKKPTAKTATKKATVKKSK